MREFTTLHTLETIEAFINKHELAFLFISQPNCSVCHGLLPQIQALMKAYPQIELAYVDALELEAIAGKFSVFTVPVLLLFVHGKEYVREARIVHIDLLNNKIKKIYDHIT